MLQNVSTDKILSIKAFFNEAMPKNRDPMSRDQEFFFPTEKDKSGLQNIGQTSFTRHKTMLSVLLSSLHSRPKKPLKILAAPSSIGCEAFTLAALGLRQEKNIRIDAFDRSKTYTDIARMGAYPKTMAQHSMEDEKLLFDHTQERNGLIPVKKQVQSKVTFLEPRAFQDFSPDKEYDVVIVNNLFQYLNEDETRSALKSIRDTNARLVVFCEDPRLAESTSILGPYIRPSRHEDWRNSPLCTQRTSPIYTYLVREDKPGLTL